MNLYFRKSGTVMSNDDIDKSYVSPYDKFLYGFDASHKPSKSQQAEIKKHRLIAEKRDNKDYQDNSGDLWEAF